MGIADFWPVSIILLINTIVALIVFFAGLFQAPGRRGTVLMFSWFIFICPVAAILFVVFGKLISHFYKTQNVDLEDISFSKEREKIVFPPNRDVEMNYVPLEDAMVVTDTANLRQLLIDVLKNNDREMLKGIACAINNSDTEVSHYAAAAILDILSDFRASVQNLLMQIKRYPDIVKINLFALEYIYQMLTMNIMNDAEQRSMIYTENEVAENLFKYNVWYMTAEHYLWLTDLMISVQDYPIAETWADRAWEHCKGQLDTYKARLHIYYAEKRTDAFLACIKELKNTDIAVDKEILNIFRIYG